MRIRIIIFIVTILSATNHFAQTKNSLKVTNKKIPVLNIGVFHMGETSDAHTTEYNEASKKAKQEIKTINETIAKFKPTIILVEEEPKYQQDLEKAYHTYLQNKKAKTGYENNEIKLLGFEIGRLANTKKIVGIDHRMSYNYNMYPLAQKLNAHKFFETGKRLKELQSSVDVDVEKIGLKNMLLVINTDNAYDFLININADMLMYVNSKDNYEGADEASKFYKRNIRMFANINKIKMDKNDRILIISGATHAAFFNKLFKRSMIYELVPISDYLN